MSRRLIHSAVAVFLLILHPLSGADAFKFEEVSQRAAAGDVEAMFDVGRAYYTGQGAARDFAKAAGYFRTAAEAGHAKAQTNLGSLYVEGRGVEKDIAKGVEWFRKAAAQGDSNAMLNLGWMAFEGLGANPDPATGLEWYRKAADAGLAEAQLRLGDLYYWGRKGVEKDLPVAARLLEKAARQGIATAQNTFGVMLETGEGANKDPQMAVRFFRAAAEQGDARGQMNLGRMFADAIGVEQDYEAACYWFALSIAGREPSSEKRLEELVLNRRVTMKQVNEARILAATFTPKPSAPLP